MTILDQLVSKLEIGFSGKLVSVILYGSGAVDGQTDRFSDFNVLCVLKQITPAELAQGEPIFRWWRGQRQPSPLLLSEEELACSADTFPIEFRDMQRRRRVLFGTDPIANLAVDGSQYRTQIEYELRSSLLRLRQQGAAVLSHPDALLSLCAESVKTFCVLGRHALLLAGLDAPEDRHEMVKRLAQAVRANLVSFDALLDVRAGQETLVPPLDLFGSYLTEIDSVIAFVDRTKFRA